MKKPPATHAYIGIYDGICKAACVDLGGIGTAQFVYDVIAEGGFIERVTIEVAQKANFREWPMVDDLVTP